MIFFLNHFFLIIQPYTCLTYRFCLILQKLSPFSQIFFEFFHSHFESKFELVISLAFYRSIRCFFWLLDGIQVYNKYLKVLKTLRRGWTPDPVVNSHLLYRLSYPGMCLSERTYKDSLSIFNRFSIFIYRGQDLNLHTFRNLVLSQACLPFHHLGDFYFGTLGFEPR